MTDRTDEERRTILKHARVIRAIRSLRGWTQVDLASRMNTRPETISAIESGHRDSTRYTHAVCEAAGLRLGEFDLLCDIYTNSDKRLEPQAVSV